MYLVKVYVTYKEPILNPQGGAVREAAHRLGFIEVTEIRVDRYLEMHVQQAEVVEEKIEQIRDRLLANVNVGSYRFEILSLEGIQIKLVMIVFPGSNCDADLLWAVKEMVGIDVEFVRRDAASLAKSNGVLLPSGFSHSDYLRYDTTARFSPIINEVTHFTTEGKMVFGTCDGFQILTEIGLLPGTLLRNDSPRFICKGIPLRVDIHTKFISEYPENVSIHLPVAHGEGNYYCDEKTSKEPKEKNQIAFTYQEKMNGSLANIAGIYNGQGSVLGMMPHPKRVMEELLGSTGGRDFFAPVIKNFGKELSQR